MNDIDGNEERRLEEGFSLGNADNELVAVLNEFTLSVRELNAKYAELLENTRRIHTESGELHAALQKATEGAAEQRERSCANIAELADLAKELADLITSTHIELLENSRKISEESGGIQTAIRQAAEEATDQREHDLAKLAELSGLVKDLAESAGVAQLELLENTRKIYEESGGIQTAIRQLAEGAAYQREHDRAEIAGLSGLVKGFAESFGATQAEMLENARRGNTESEKLHTAIREATEEAAKQREHSCANLAELSDLAKELADLISSTHTELLENSRRINEESGVIRTAIRKVSEEVASQWEQNRTEVAELAGLVKELAASTSSRQTESLEKTSKISEESGEIQLAIRQAAEETASQREHDLAKLTELSGLVKDLAESAGVAQLELLENTRKIYEESGGIQTAIRQLAEDATNQRERGRAEIAGLSSLTKELADLISSTYTELLENTSKINTESGGIQTAIRQLAEEAANQREHDRAEHAEFSDLVKRLADSTGDLGARLRSLVDEKTGLSRLDPAFVSTVDRKLGNLIASFGEGNRETLDALREMDENVHASLQDSRNLAVLTQKTVEALPKLLKGHYSESIATLTEKTAAFESALTALDELEKKTAEKQQAFDDRLTALEKRVKEKMDRTYFFQLMVFASQWVALIVFMLFSFWKV